MRGLPPHLAQVLMLLPGLLADSAPGIPGRAAVSPYEDDEESDEEWVRHGTPELLHLFASAREVVLEDLGSLRRDRWGAFRLDIPPGHEPAWLSALAAVRVALGESNELTSEDMGRAFPEEVRSRRGRTVVIVGLLGWMQELLIPPEAKEGFEGG